jgi:nitrite reductase/ring-hydroxylating ferredoxin subunit
MSTFIRIARSSDVKERFGTGKELNGISVALFRHKGRVYALHNSCPHQGAPIHPGFVRDDCVVCPHHGWTFRLEDGAFIHNDMLRIRTYPVKEEDGNIFINPDPEDQPA